MDDWMFPLGESSKENKNLHPLTDSLMGDSMFKGSLHPQLDEGLAQSNFGIGSKIGNEAGWQLPFDREKKNQTILDKLAEKKTKADITKGTLMAQGIGRFLNKLKTMSNGGLGIGDEEL